LLFLAAIVVAGSVLWVWWPAPAPLQPVPVPAPDSTIGPDAGQRGAETPRPRSAPSPAPGGSGVPVRILVLNASAGTFIVEMCDTTTTEVLIRWYATSPPSGPVIEHERVQVLGGQATLPLRDELTPTAQAIDGSNRPIGTEVGPGQLGSCS
jgi:hypothetical protein